MYALRKSGCLVTSGDSNFIHASKIGAALATGTLAACAGVAGGTAGG